MLKFSCDGSEKLVASCTTVLWNVLALGWTEVVFTCRAQQQIEAKELPQVLEVT